MRAKIGAVAAWPCLRSAPPCQRRAGENPRRLGGAGGELDLDLAREEGPRQAFRPVLCLRAGSLRRHAADGHGDRQQRGGDRRSRLFDACRSRSRTPAWTTSASSPTTSRTASATTGRSVTPCSPTARSKRSRTSRARSLATNADGSAVDIAMRAMLHKHGLENKRDYTVIEAPFPAMRAMLAENKVDLIPGVLPFALDPELTKIGNHAVHRQGRHRRVGVRQLPGAQAVHRQEPRGAGRLAGRHAAHPALVPRPEEPRRSGADRGPPGQSAAGTLRLGLHQERPLSRSGDVAEPRRAAEERRHDQGTRLRQRQLRRQSLFRSEHGRRGRQAVEIMPRLHRGVMAGHGCSKNGVASLGHAPAIRVFRRKR